eukprot:scaffold325519_cov54-Tisochrysis_lutea.AAC.7
MLTAHNASEQAATSKRQQRMLVKRLIPFDPSFAEMLLMVASLLRSYPQPDRLLPSDGARATRAYMEDF